MQHLGKSTRDGIETPVVVYSITKMAVHVLDMSFANRCEVTHVSPLVIELADIFQKIQIYQICASQTQACIS